MYYEKVEKDVKIAVEDINPHGKHTVFFIHGWPLNRKIFEYQFNILPKYGFRCVSIDLRGFGQSDSPWHGYSYDCLSDDVYTVIKNLNVKTLTLVGFSMGGAIALRYMARHKGYKVGKLALLGAAAPSLIKSPTYPYGMTEEEVNKNLIDSTYKDRAQMAIDFGKLLLESDHSNAVKSWFNSLSLKASGHGTIKAAESLRDERLFKDMAKVKVPTGIFHGVLDKVCDFNFALQMNKGIENSRLYPFEKSGHGVFYDELEKFNREFLEFLQE